MTQPAIDAAIAWLERMVRNGYCDGCGTTRARCLEHKASGALKCCPDCRHERDTDGLTTALACLRDYVPRMQREEALYVAMGAVMRRVEAGTYSPEAHESIDRARRLLKLEP